MSLPELFAAMDGYCEAKGVKRSDPAATGTYPTAEEVAALFAGLDEEGRPRHG